MENNLTTEQLEGMTGHFQQKFLAAEADVALLRIEVNRLNQENQRLQKELNVWEESDKGVTEAAKPTSAGSDAVPERDGG